MRAIPSSGVGAGSPIVVDGNGGGGHGHHGRWRRPWLWPWNYAVPYAVPVEIPLCPPPFDNGRLFVTPRWATECFAPTYESARALWGGNAAALSTEILLQIMPDAAIGVPMTGPERELRRRIDLAVAVLLGAEGIPTRFPPNPVTPRPVGARRIAVPWIRALVTGWI